MTVHAIHETLAQRAAREALEQAQEVAAREWDLACTRAAVDLDRILATAEMKGGPRRFFQIDGAQLLDMEFPATPWLIRGLLKDHGLQGVAAEPKNIKTWVMMEGAFATASGCPAFGEFEMCGEPGHVAIFAGEDHLRACKAKLRAIGASKNMSAKKLQEVAGRFHFEALTKIDVRNKAHLVELVASARSLREKPKLMIFDPLIKVHGAKENDSTEMELVTGNLAAVGKAVGCAVQFVHHNAKSNEQSKGRRGGQKMRGSGGLHGAVDGGLYLDPPAGDRTTEWSVRIESEIKGALSAPPFTLVLKVLEDDEHGEAKLISWTVKKGDPAELSLEDKILEVLRNEPSGASKNEIRSRCGCRDEAVKVALKALIDRRAVFFDGTGRSSRYFIESDEDPFDP